MMCLAIDPGVSGWMAVVDGAGVRCIRPIPVTKVTKETRKQVKNPKAGEQKTKVVTRTRTFVNYPVATATIKAFRDFGIEHGIDTHVVYEDCNVAHSQDVITTVQQHVGIATWPIICSCCDVKCFSLMNTKWKKAMGLTKDKHDSLEMLAQLAPDLNINGSDDLAEACLLGYYYLKEVYQ